jgi:hypothetical protein
VQREIKQNCDEGRTNRLNTIVMTVINAYIFCKGVFLIVVRIVRQTPFLNNSEGESKSRISIPPWVMVEIGIDKSQQKKQEERFSFHARIHRLSFFTSG